MTAIEMIGQKDASRSPRHETKGADDGCTACCTDPAHHQVDVIVDAERYRGAASVRRRHVVGEGEP